MTENIWKYSLDGSFQEYLVPELDTSELDSYDRNQMLRDAGFYPLDGLGGTFCGFEMSIWSHETHGFLVDIGFTFTFLIGQVICANPPTLLCFLRDFAPLLQVMTVNSLAERTTETIFNPRLGVEPVVRVEKEAARRREELR